MVRASVEQRRHEAEVKYWWDYTGGNPALIREALERIGKKRSARAVEKLRAGLMEIYKQQKARP